MTGPDTWDDIPSGIPDELWELIEGDGDINSWC